MRQAVGRSDLRSGSARRAGRRLVEVPTTRTMSGYPRGLAWTGLVTADEERDFRGAALEIGSRSGEGPREDVQGPAGRDAASARFRLAAVILGPGVVPLLYDGLELVVRYQLGGNISFRRDGEREALG